MSLFPFTTIQSYAEMKKKISLFTFFIVLILTYFLENQIPELKKFLNMGAIDVDIWQLKVPIALFIVASLVTIISKTIVLHDRLSDILGIRSRFDINHILIPMANLLKIEFGEKGLKDLKKDRHDVMYQNFYKYASSDPEKTVIDRHSVTLALDQWCWFWIILKTMFFSLISGIILLFYGIFFYALVGIVLELFLFILLIASYKISRKLALREVKEILDDDVRKNKIKDNLIALQG